MIASKLHEARVHYDWFMVDGKGLKSFQMAHAEVLCNDEKQHSCP